MGSIPTRSAKGNDMLTRPFYGIILGAWAFGYFSAQKTQKAKLRVFRTPVDVFKYYGFCWKSTFFGRFVRVGWAFQELLSAATEMSLKDPNYKMLAVKLDASKQLSDLNYKELQSIQDYATGKLVIPEPVQVQGLQIVSDPTKKPRERKSRAKEQLIFAEIEHELRNPVTQKLFDLVSKRFGRDVCLRWWRHPPTREAWEVMFKDQLPNPGSVKIQGEGDIPPQPSQAEVARELTAQFEENSRLL